MTSQPYTHARFHKISYQAALITYSSAPSPSHSHSHSHSHSLTLIYMIHLTVAARLAVFLATLVLLSTQWGESIPEEQARR